MSGYAEGILVLLAINVVFAYGAFLPLAAGQLNLGLAGFAAIGAYASAYLSNTYASRPLLAIPAGAVFAGLVALAVAVPVLRTRGIYLALATFAVGQIVQAAILNLEFIGGAAGYPVTAFIRLPVVLVLRWRSYRVRLAAVRHALRHCGARRAGRRARRRPDGHRGARASKMPHSRSAPPLPASAAALYAHHFSFIEAQYFNIGLSISIVLYVLLGGTQTCSGR